MASGNGDRPLRVLGVGNGRSIIFLRWAWRVAELGHDVHVVSDRSPTAPSELEGITAHRLQELELAHADQGPAADAVRARRSATWPARLDVDLVHAHYLLPYGYWAAEAGVHPLVMSPWNTDIFTYGRDRARGRKRVPGRRRGRRRVRRELDRERRRDRPPGRRSRPGAPDRLVRRPAPVRPRAPRARPGRPVRLAGRLAGHPVAAQLPPNTNLDVLLRAFDRVSKEEPRVRLIMAARGGWIRDEIEALLDELGLRDRVAQHFAPRRTSCPSCARRRTSASRSPRPTPPRLDDRVDGVAACRW